MAWNCAACSSRKILPHSSHFKLCAVCSEITPSALSENASQDERFCDAILGIPARRTLVRNPIRLFFSFFIVNIRVILMLLEPIQGGLKTRVLGRFQGLFGSVLGHSKFQKCLVVCCHGRGTTRLWRKYARKMRNAKCKRRSEVKSPRPSNLFISKKENSQYRPW